MYKINSTRIDGETLTTNVTYTFKDKTEITIDVPHFLPQNAEDVIQGIKNRYASESVKYIAEQVNTEIVKELPIGKQQEI